MEERDLIVCEECGSTEIQTQAWVDANTHEYIGETGIDRDDNWCALSQDFDKLHYP